MPSTPLSTSPRSGLYFVPNRHVRRHGMRALLNSLGLTLWSSIAIVLAVGLALVGYRVSLTIGNSPAAMSSPPTLGNGVEAAPAMSYGSATRPSKSAPAPSHGETVSRVI